MSYADIHRAAAVVMTKQIFSVVGCQKSGTTWVQRILDAHPEAVCRGETAFGTVFFPAIKHLVREFNHQQEFRNSQFGQIPPENLMNDEHVKYMFANMSAMMMSQWFDVDDQAIKAVGEKTPEHATSLPLMDAVFPGIKIINIVRDPRAATTRRYPVVADGAKH